jgi:hypothetical protein
VRITCGEFAELRRFDRECQHVAWQETVFGLYLADEKIKPEFVENVRSWPHCGFRVHQSVFLLSGDQADIVHLIQYMMHMIRCPCCPSRLTKG